MKVPDDAIIADEKLTLYLLVPRPWDDKSGFLAQAGFGPENPDVLKSAIRELAGSSEAVEDGANEYGEFLRVEGNLVGPRGTLKTVLIWLRRYADGKVYFVTLKRMKETRK